MLHKSAKILIVDDSHLQRKILSIILRDIGYTNIVETSDGYNAIKIVRESDIDLVFLDTVMPNMNGLEALQLLKTTNIDLPVIMLSTISESETISFCKNSGALGVLNKTLDQHDIKSTLSRLLQDVC